MTDDVRPVLTVFAGPNGAGKSTLRADMEDRGVNFGPEIDPDAIARQIVAARGSGNVSDNDIMRQAGRDALDQMKAHIANGTSFSRETTLSGKEPLRMMQQAKAAGFEVNMIYVGVDAVRESMDRVDQRVSKGGHSIPKEAQERRFDKSMDNAPKAAAIADRVDYYHNGLEGYEHVASAERGKLAYRDPDAPNWTAQATADLSSEMSLDAPRTRADYLEEIRTVVASMPDGPGKTIVSDHLTAMEQAQNKTPSRGDRDDDFER